MAQWRIRPTWRNCDLQSVDTSTGATDQGGAQHVQNGDGSSRDLESLYSFSLNLAFSAAFKKTIQGCLVRNRIPRCVTIIGTACCFVIFQKEFTFQQLIRLSSRFLNFLALSRLVLYSTHFPLSIPVTLPGEVLSGSGRHVSHNRVMNLSTLIISVFQLLFLSRPLGFLVVSSI